MTAMSDPASVLSADQASSHSRFWRCLFGKRFIINVLAATALVGAWMADVPEPVLATLLFIHLGLACWAIGTQRGIALLGPLFWYDLARLARRQRTTLLRCTYGLLLLGWLAYTVQDQFP